MPANYTPEQAQAQRAQREGPRVKSDVVLGQGSLSGRDSGRVVGGTMEPRRRGVGFLGLEANWPEFSLWQSVQFCCCRGPVSNRNVERTFIFSYPQAGPADYPIFQG